MSRAVPRYAPAILDALAGHGLAPRADTTPRALRDAVNDLYRYEIRRLRDRCRAGEFPSSALAGHVVRLRQRYVLLSIPLDRWVEPDARRPEPRVPSPKPR